MTWPWGQKDDVKPLERRLLSRLRELEATVAELSDDIASCNAKIARINAKTAVEARETQKRAKSREEKLLEDILGGEVVSIKDADDVTTKTG